MMRLAPRLGAELGLKKLWIKSDAGNPTHSFKDRVVSVAISVARSFGYEVVRVPRRAISRTPSRLMQPPPECKVSCSFRRISNWARSPAPSSSGGM